MRTDKEVELLLACSRPQVDSESAKRISALLKEEMDWAWITKAARAHGVMPLLYRHLKAAGPGAVPTEIYLDLQKVYLLNTRRNLILAKELLGIIKALSEHGILAVPFKGPALSQMAYGDITCRSFSDLDIMVAKDDVLPARDILISRGYNPNSGSLHGKKGMSCKMNVNIILFVKILSFWSRFTGDFIWIFTQFRLAKEFGLDWRV